MILNFHDIKTILGSLRTVIMRDPFQLEVNYIYDIDPTPA